MVKLASKIRLLINEMGRSGTEFTDKFRALSDQIEKTIFLLAFSTDREPENHWTKELNGIIKPLYKTNVKGNKNQKNFSKQEVLAKLLHVFAPMDSFLQDLKTAYTHDGYTIQEELDQEKIKALCNLLADRITAKQLTFLKLTDVQQVLK